MASTATAAGNSSNSSSKNHHERSPLLLSTADGDSDDSMYGGDEHDFHPRHHRHGSATVPETIANLMKTCMGTGCLALPYAAQQGGLLLHIFGIIAIALWNTYGLKRLCQCLELLESSYSSQQQKDLNGEAQNPKPDSTATAPKTKTTIVITLSPPPPGTATFGKVAWYALGPPGLMALDIMTVILLLGIVVAYQDAIRSFLRDTPFTTKSDILDAIIIALMMMPLSLVPDVGYLAKASAAGLTVLGFCFLVIAGYGIFEYYTADDNNYGDTTLTTSSIEVHHSATSWLPRDGLTGASQWFGCVVFGFGVVPLTYNFRESMAEPTKLVGATAVALIGVAVSYIIVGIGLLVLYPHIEGDVMHELPTVGIIPTVTRLAMAVVVFATAPLLIVPCGQLLEGKLQTSNNETDEQTKIVVRLGICLLTVALSVGFPGFVNVLSFVGCFCVALVGFCIPPLLHLVLLYRQRARPAKSMVFWVDGVMLLWGILATCITTVYTFRKVSSSVTTPSI
jgi:amino acid permease